MYLSALTHLQRLQVQPASTTKRHMAGLSPATQDTFVRFAGVTLSQKATEKAHTVLLKTLPTTNNALDALREIHLAILRHDPKASKKAAKGLQEAKPTEASSAEPIGPKITKTATINLIDDFDDDAEVVKQAISMLEQVILCHTLLEGVLSQNNNPNPSDRLEDFLANFIRQQIVREPSSREPRATAFDSCLQRGNSRAQLYALQQQLQQIPKDVLDETTTRLITDIENQVSAYLDQTARDTAKRLITGMKEKQNSSEQAATLLQQLTQFLMREGENITYYDPEEMPNVALQAITSALATQLSPQAGTEDFTPNHLGERAQQLLTTFDQDGNYTPTNPLRQIMLSFATHRRLSSQTLGMLINH